MTKRSCTILVVEDDQDIRETIETALEMEGYSVATAVNGQEALNYLRISAKPNLVLLDMMMPIMGGREFLDILLSDVVLAPIPVFILSAVANDKNTQGAVGFIKKPADLDVILKMVEKYC
jgi:CheY-like chemotaxis protein